MKRLIIFSVALVLAYASLASAQSSGTQPLADVAKAEEARRKDVNKPAKVITNSDLKPDISRGSPSPATAAPAESATTTPANTTPGAPAAAAKPDAPAPRIRRIGPAA